MIMAERLLVAFMIGVIIGFDREKSGKAAGIRTQMLVCVGSALLAIISIYLGPQYNRTIADPARLMAQIVSGIGFLGAGVILKNGSKLQGVTTAATIWTTAAVGIAVGCGFYVPAGLVTLMLLSLNPIAHYQYKYGLKGDFYLIKTPIENEEKLEKIFASLLTDIRQRSVISGSLIATIHSSQQKNKEIIAVLKKKKVPFEITIVEE